MTKFQRFKGFGGSTIMVRNRGSVSKTVRKYVKSQIRKEKEKGYCDNFGNLATEPATNSAVFLLLNSKINDNVDDGQPNAVTGLQAKMLRLEGSMTYRNTGSKEHSLRRYIIFDKDVDGATPAVTDFLRINDSDSVRAIEHLSSGRFKVLSDKRFKIGGNTSATPGSAVLQHSVNMKIDVPLTHFASGGANGSITGIVKGALYLLTVGDDTSANMSIATDVEIRVHYEA